MASQAQERGIRLELLGRFRALVDEEAIPADAWPSRRAAELVQLLALADDHRLTRDEAIEALWPHLDADAGAANLRKAAHHARQALGEPDAVVLRGGQVALFPSRSIETDVARFQAEADPSLYAGELLPEARYEEWTQAPRDSLRSQAVELLRRGGEWERLVEVDPTDEPAYRELMRRELAAGSRPAAIRCYGRLRSTLRRELGIPPSAETRAIYDECVAGLGAAEPAFVGRQLELARATALLRGEPGGTLVVRGPAGIGKSAFCRELARVAQAEGWKVITTQATEDSAPYAPLARAVERVQALDPSAVGALGIRGRAVAAELISPAVGGQPPLTRHQVIGAVRRLLLAAGDGAPVALVVDDAHLADEATIDVLNHIGSTTGTPLLPVFAYRAEQAPEALTRGVARLARAGSVVEIDLEPLDREDAAALVAVGTPIPRAGDVIDRIVELADGNPFLTLELTRSAVAGVPALVATARDAIASRFLHLDEDGVATLRRVALASDELDPSAAVALAGSSEAEAFALLDQALAAGILIVSGAHYRFRHELVRQALVDRLAPHERLALHRDIAQRLAGADAPPGLIARHWLAGDRPDQAQEWLLAAANQAVKLGAYADALVHLAALLDHEPEHVEGLSLRAEAMDARGDSGAPAAYAAAARVVGEPEAYNLRAKQALAQIKLGDPPGGMQVLEGVEPTSAEGRLAQALAFAGAAALGFADPAIGTAKAAEARRMALDAGDPDAVAIASWAHAAAAHARGELRGSVEADLRETHSLPKLAVSVFDGQLCITQRLLYGARPYPDVIAFTDAFVEEAKRLGAARGHAFAVTIRGEAKLLSGRLDEADVDLAEGMQLHREIGAATGESFALQRRAEVALNRGQRDRGLALLDEALAIARESDVGFHLLDRIYGTRITAAADPESALAALEEAEEAVRGPVETCPGCRITLAVPAAIAAARAGDLERLDHWEEAAEFLATVVMRLPAWNAALLEVRAHRARATGDSDTARDLFRAAANGFAAAGQPLDEARCAALLERVAR
jgi:DNA-binding SARP family transcriptional activator/tetratricopeptide (TPR) repeat protein